MYQNNISYIGDGGRSAVVLKIVCWRWQKLSIGH